MPTKDPTPKKDPTPFVILEGTKEQKDYILKHLTPDECIKILIAAIPQKIQ